MVAFRRWWDAVAVPEVGKHLLKYGQSAPTKKIIDGILPKGPNAKEILEGWRLLSEAYRE